jgi:tetratricopeptide (TPR) repeat protein
VNRERGRETEYEEILGYHLEQAYQYLSELGPLDDRGREIGRRAAGKLSSAGRRAFGRGDMGAASNLLRRGVQLLPEGSLDRLLLLPELAEALTATGEFAWAEVFLDEAAAYATAAGDERLGGRARLVRLMSKLHAGTSDDWTETVLSESREVIPVFERAEDHVGLSKAWRLIMDAHGIGYRFADATEAAERAASHAQLAGDARGLIGALAGRAMAAFYGPTSVVDAIALCEEVLERSTNRRASGFVMGLLAQLRAMKGEFDAARELYVRARGTLEDAGGQILAASASLGAFTIEALAGDPAAAEPELREHYEALGRMGETYVRPTLAACLAWALFTQGRYEEAEELVGVAKDVAAADDVESQALWRSVQARLLVRRGSMEDAIALAGEAVGLLSSTDGLLKQADALMALAEVLSAAGSSEDSERVTLDAVALYEKKGNEAAARAARAALAERSRRPSLSGSS